MFVTQEWINYLLFSKNSSFQITVDFRQSGMHTFQALNTFCELVDRTIYDSLPQFYLNQYVSTTVTPSDLFQSQIQTSIQQFISSTTNIFLLSLNIIGRTTQANALFAAILTNYGFGIASEGTRLVLVQFIFPNCNCKTQSTCVEQHAIYNYPYNTRMFDIPGLYRGCYIVEALLQSTLECFYNQTCINQLQSHLRSSLPMTIIALNSSLPTNYSVTSTIQQLLDGLMVENWNVSLTYESYYNACQPIECIYTYETRNGVVYIITTIIGLVGGLISVLRVFVPILVKFVRRKRRSATSENGKIFGKNIDVLHITKRYS
jgi:hypothetical protein